MPGAVACAGWRSPSIAWDAAPSGSACRTQTTSAYHERKPAQHGPLAMRRAPASRPRGEVLGRCRRGWVRGRTRGRGRFRGHGGPPSGMRLCEPPNVRPTTSPCNGSSTRPGGENYVPIGTTWRVRIHAQPSAPSPPTARESSSRSRKDVTKTKKDGTRGRLKIDYGDRQVANNPAAAIKWLWKFIDGAKPAGEALRPGAGGHRRRALRRPRIVLPSSQRHHPAAPRLSQGPGGESAGEARGPHVPASIKQLSKAIDVAHVVLHKAEDA